MPAGTCNRHCSTAKRPSQEQVDGSERYRYDNCVSYQLDVATFHDSNGDGVGDFRGLTARLDYLRELG